MTVAVVGAGLAGLRCAGLLCAQGFQVQLIERGRVGGRVGGTSFNGFVLDSGFQVPSLWSPSGCMQGLHSVA